MHLFQKNCKEVEMDMIMKASRTTIANIRKIIIILSYFLKEDFIVTPLSSGVVIKSSLRQYDKMVYKLQRV